MRARPAFPHPSSPAISTSRASAVRSSRGTFTYGSCATFSLCSLATESDPSTRPMARASAERSPLTRSTSRSILRTSALRSVPSTSVVERSSCSVVRRPRWRDVSWHLALLSGYLQLLARKVCVFNREVRLREHDEFGTELIGAFELHLFFKKSQMRRELSSERIDLGYVLLGFREFLLRFTFLNSYIFNPSASSSIARRSRVLASSILSDSP